MVKDVFLHNGGQRNTFMYVADTATEPKTIPPAIFKNGREVITTEI